MSAPTKLMPVYDIGKALFLVCCGIIPHETGMVDGRSVFRFDREEADPHARIWDRLKSRVIDASKSGVAATPSELETMSSKLFKALEEGALR